MFDFSFFELLVICVVALLVIGPERLPGAIRTGALWLGRLKRTITETRTEIEKHIGADEIRRQLHNEQVLASLEKLKESRAALERDLLDYQAKLDAELRDTEVIDQPPEVTYDHHQDHGEPVPGELEHNPHHDAQTQTVNLHKAKLSEHEIAGATDVENLSKHPSPPASDSH